MFVAAALTLAPVVLCDRFLAETFPPDKPGAAVAVVRHGTVLLAKGYGLADVAAKTPITRRTAFDLASLSKPFTALAVARLIDRGKLRPDDDVRTWLPTVPAKDPARPVRVRDLLQHTSGLPHCYGLPGLSPAAPGFATKTNADVLAAVAAAEPGRRPGEAFDYNNSNYVLLAELVRAVDGRPLRQLLADEVFGPLGMADTRVCDAVPFAVPNRAAGYRRGKPRRADAAIHGDGGVFSTLDDLLTWDAALSAGKLLSPATRRAADAAGTLDGGKPVEYAWGWLALGPFRQHGGQWAGARTLALRGQAVGFTLLVLSNDEAADVLAVQEGVLERMFGR